MNGGVVDFDGVDVEPFDEELKRAQFDENAPRRKEGDAIEVQHFDIGCDKLSVAGINIEIADFEVETELFLKLFVNAFDHEAKRRFTGRSAHQSVAGENPQQQRDPSLVAAQQAHQRSTSFDRGPSGPLHRR